MPGSSPPSLRKSLRMRFHSSLNQGVKRSGAARSSASRAAGVTKRQRCNLVARWSRTSSSGRCRVDQHSSCSAPEVLVDGVVGELVEKPELGAQAQLLIQAADVRRRPLSRRGGDGRSSCWTSTAATGASARCAAGGGLVRAGRTRRARTRDAARRCRRGHSRSCCDEPISLILRIDEDQLLALEGDDLCARPATRRSSANLHLHRLIAWRRRIACTTRSAPFADTRR